MQLKCRALTLCLCLLFLTRIAAQEYSYTHYDTKDGLAGSTVHGMAQSKDGFMWFATETGLSRFDGVHFKTFTMADGLPANEILGVFTDSRDRVWLTPFKNSICYYADGKIHNQENDSNLKKVSITGLMMGIAESDKGDVLIYESSYIHVITADHQVTAVPVEKDGTITQMKPPFFNIMKLTGGLPSGMVAPPEVLNVSPRDLLL